MRLHQGLTGQAHQPRQALGRHSHDPVGARFRFLEQALPMLAVPEHGVAGVLLGFIPARSAIAEAGQQQAGTT